MGTLRRRYLALLTGASEKLAVKPAGILSYYGYGFLTDGWYDASSLWYNSLPEVPESCLRAIPSEPHCTGPLETHYSVYVYARQKGLWKDLIYSGREKFFFIDYSLRLKDRLQAPLFCAHSTGDNDVPSRNSTRFHPSICRRNTSPPPGIMTSTETRTVLSPMNC